MIYNIKTLKSNTHLKLQSMIYYTVRSPRLETWLEMEAIQNGLVTYADENYSDLDPTFNPNIDSDYDTKIKGITRESFCGAYHAWIIYCVESRDKVCV